MNITTKYNTGDLVYLLHKGEIVQDKVIYTQVNIHADESYSVMYGLERLFITIEEEHLKSKREDFMRE